MALSYEIVTVNRTGHERVQPWVAEEELEPGTVIHVGGRDWLIERIEDGDVPRTYAKPARYRVRLVYPDGREDLGGFRRYRPNGPRLGHAFTTIVGGEPISWTVMDEQLAYDGNGDPYLDLVAERDFAEVDGDLPDHELEHARADEAGLAVELAALEPGEAPDWEEAARYVDALTLTTVEDDLIEQCGVDPDTSPEDAWIGLVKERLRDDLENFRADVEGGHDEIQEWEFRDGRIFAAVGSPDEESDPLRGYGWMCRLLDSGALGAAGFSRVRKAELVD
jgi:hypothetical protein